MSIKDEFGKAMASGGTDQLWICPRCKKENVSDFAVEDDCTCEACGAAYLWGWVVSPEQIRFLESQLLIDVLVEGSH